MIKHPHNLTISPQTPMYQCSYSLISLGLLVKVKTCQMREKLGVATIYTTRCPLIMNADPIVNARLNLAYPWRMQPVHHGHK